MSQAHSTIVSNFDLTGKLPSRSEIGALDPEIFGEGQRVVMDAGDADIPFSPPPEKLTMPDWSGIKSIRKYFGRRDYQVFPSWFYHPTEEPRLMKTSDQAKRELGVFYRSATIDERGRTGLSHTWDWEENSKWRAFPYGVQKFDPGKPAQGKIYQASAPNPVIAQNALIEALIPAVAAAVAQSLKASGPGAPANVDEKQWGAFLEFQAWQKTREAVDELQNEPDDDGMPEAGNALSASKQALDKETVIAEAEAKGIKVDRRWSVDRLLSEIEQAG